MESKSEIEVLIAGAGLAGLTAAGLLASRKRVRVFEKKRYPCVKLCGEFLSPEGLQTLARATGFSTARILSELNASEVRKFTWFSRSGREFRMELDPMGYGVRRDRLDPWLAEWARQRGAEILFESEVLPPKTDQISLWATGKENRDLRKSPYFAVKGYCRGSMNGLDIALYQLRGGYIGFTRMADDELSYCALIDRRKTDQSWKYSDWNGLHHGIFKTNSTLHSWAASCSPTLERHVGAASFDFRGRGPVRQSRWYAGDSAQLLPPFVGDGMAFAIESGELAAEALSRNYSSLRYRFEWYRRFRSRILAARVIHPLLWMGYGHETILCFLSVKPALGTWIYRSTRGRTTPRSNV